MRTDDLIEALSRDAASARAASSVEARMAKAAFIAVAAAAILFAVTLGTRADIAAAMQTPWYPLKIALLLLLAGAAFTLVSSMARPGARLSPAPLALVAAAFAAAIIADVASLGTSGLSERLVGNNALVCLTRVPMLGVLPLVAALSVLRYGAPTRPGLSGAAAGLFAGAVGGALYAVFCNDDSPLFVAVWYTLAISGLSALGAVIGRAALRW